MASIPDSLLAIDIETASPNRSPEGSDFRDTDYFELVAVGIGHQPAPGEPVETAVLFRDGGWDVEATTDLLRRIDDWCRGREAEGILTHNGNRFDAIHLGGWAQRAVEHGTWPDAASRLDALFEHHVDLNPIAVEAYAERLESWRTTVALEDVCRWEGIPVESTRYADYGVGPVANHPAIDGETVTNVHIGKVLGEAYVAQLVEGRTDTHEFAELERLLTDYTNGDIEPLFQLARSFAD